VIKNYVVGQEVILTAHFLTRNNASFAPGAVTGKVKPPGSAPVVVVFTGTGVLGEYEATYIPLVDGKFWWEATNGVDIIDQRAFNVIERKVV
jgi:hypothetical protein